MGRNIIQMQKRLSVMTFQAACGASNAFLLKHASRYLAEFDYRFTRELDLPP